jgi:hypothetical protein
MPRTGLVMFLLLLLPVCMLGSTANTAPLGNSKLLPAGTEINVRTNVAIDSKNAVEGHRYAAEIADDVRDSSGAVIIPKGSDAELIIRKMSSGGTTGTPDLMVDLDSVTVGGQRYVVNTTDVRESGRQGIGKNKRTAQMVGGGAALGALIGAIAGHGKGAAIGAAAGAGAGATAQVLTKGKEVHVPAETLLRFRLDTDLHLNSAE